MYRRERITGGGRLVVAVAVLALTLCLPAAASADSQITLIRVYRTSDGTVFDVCQGKFDPPVTDAMNPAGWPSAYQPIIWPMNVAAIAPAMPRMAVSQKPEGPLPGVTALAIKPATNPIKIVQIQCIMCVSSS